MQRPASFLAWLKEMLDQWPDVGRVALLCNAALMALKVAPLQGRWPWVQLLEQTRDRTPTR